jgi:hypothetical protein
MKGSLAERSFAATYRSAVFTTRDQWRRRRYGSAVALLDEERLVQFVVDFHKIKPVYTHAVLTSLVSAIRSIAKRVEAEHLFHFDTKRGHVELKAARQ